MPKHIPPTEKPHTKPLTATGKPTAAAQDRTAELEAAIKTAPTADAQEEAFAWLTRNPGDSSDPEKDEFHPLSETEFAALKGYLAIIRGNHGDITPAEELICSLVHCHSSIRPITPKDVERELESFRLNFDDLVAAGKYFNRLYVHLVEDEPAHQEGAL